jgi:hypothetical protein
MMSAENEAMHFQYRWLYAGLSALLIGVAGYFADLQPMLQDHEDLIARQQEIHRKLRQRQIRVSAAKNKNVDAERSLVSTKLSAFSRLLHENNIELLAITNDVDDAFRTSLLGEFNHFYQFLHALSRQENGYVISEFTLTPESSSHIRMDVLLRQSANMKNTITSNDAATHALTNPFCGAVNDKRELSSEMQNFPREEIRLLGSVDRLGKKYAVMLLPSGAVVEVEKKGSS